MERLHLWIGNQKHIIPQTAQPAVAISNVPTFEELVLKFLKYREFDRRVAAQTVAKDRECMKWFLKDLPYLKSPDQLQLEDITTLKQIMYDRGCKECRINSVLNTLKSFLQYCNSVQKILTINPKEIKTMRVPNREVIFLSNEEIKLFRDSINPNDIRDLRMLAIFETLLSTGMRIGECLSLNIDQIDWEEKEIVIIGKGNKQRTVYLTDEAIEWLRLYLLKRTYDNPALFVTFGTKQRLQRYDMSKIFQRYAQRAGIKTKLTPRILRHTHATTLKFNGCDIHTIQHDLGHSDIKTTAKYYLGVDKKAQKEAHRKYLRFE